MRRHKLSNKFWMFEEGPEPWPVLAKVLAWALGTAVWFLFLWSMFAGCIV